MADADTLLRALDPPPAFAPNDTPFWDDEHISKQMLAAHLDPEFEGASRKPDFIARSAAWVVEQAFPQGAAPQQNVPSLLDLGCGPGLYATAFAKAGCAVTGLDLSARSIAYAKAQAAVDGLAIDYRVQNYLEWEPAQTYDAAVMIYCDYGALSPENRAALMQKAHRAIRPGGRFILDVFTPAKLAAFEETQVWKNCPKGGFWSAEPYVALHLNRRYPHRVSLEQIVLLLGDTLRTIYIWNQYFTPESLAAEARAAGFELVGLADDLSGLPHTGKAETMAAVLERR